MKQARYANQKSKPNFSPEAILKIYTAALLILVFSLIRLQILNGDYYFKRAKNNYVRTIPQPAIRGRIFDRNGILLASDKAIFNISVIPYQIKNKKNSFFKKISESSGQDLTTIYRNYRQNLLSNFSPVDILSDVDKQTTFKLKEEFGDSVLINPAPQRTYISPYAFAHLLGYVKKASIFYPQLKKYGYTPLERVGISGLEQYYDTYLRGEDGGDLIEVDVKGKIVGFLGAKKPRKGKDIYITIDSRLQKIALESLDKKRGVIILMGTNDGELLTLYSSPSFDSNKFIKGEDTSDLFNTKSSPLLNRAIQATYPIGSTFKPIIAIAALEEKKITPFDTFVCSGEFKLGPNRFACWNVHGTQNLSEALFNSCNVYFYNLGLKTGADFIAKWAKNFGLDSLTGIDLPYEKKGFVPSPKWKESKLAKNWFAGDTLNFSIGQGFIMETPLGITVAINAFANEGYLVEPHLIKKIDTLHSEFSAKHYLPIKDENRKIIRDALRKTVSERNGTAHILSRLGLKIAGKTGTAQVSGHKSHGWFIGFFPYDNPKYTICIFLEHGSSSHEALRITNDFLEKAKKENLL